MNVSELLERCRKGDELAWEALVRQYQGRILAIAHGYVNDPDEARDVAQDIFVRIYRKLDTCRDADRYEEVIPICRKILQQEPDFIFAHTLLASSYAQMGRLEEARAEANEILKNNPKFTAGSAKTWAYRYEVYRERLRDSWLKAGLPP